ncbi:class I SAM-dependent methyltransferase [Candidatus Kaiserbacteria bacterium]|nr:class I SAM-dependent methyltransferase [Candidatus Kaiserbacteria bacterium]
MTDQGTAKFDRGYAKQYDALSGDIRAYEAFAKTLAGRLLDHMPNAKEVLEIGTGTGNSALVLLESAPFLEQVYGMEIEDFILLARAKQKNAVSRLFSPQRSPAYSREVQERLQAHKHKLHLIKARGEAIPIKDGTVDAVFMNQVFHWLNAEEALREIGRVLKPDGLLVFDESEFQFDFGDTVEGRQIKKEQIVDHPFIKLFQKIFNQELEQQGIVVDVKPFQYLFTLDTLRALLEKNGFEIVPNSAGDPYTITTVRYNLTQVMSFAEKGARMRIMRQMPDLLKMPGLVDKIVAAAMRKTKREWSKLPHRDEGLYGPSQAAFVARKIVHTA